MNYESFTGVFSGSGYKKGDFPIAEKVQNKIIALPFYPDMTTDRS